MNIAKADGSWVAFADGIAVSLDTTCSAGFLQTEGGGAGAEFAGFGENSPRQAGEFECC